MSEYIMIAMRLAPNIRRLVTFSVKVTGTELSGRLNFHDNEEHTV